MGLRKLNKKMAWVCVNEKIGDREEKLASLRVSSLANRSESLYYGFFKSRAVFTEALKERGRDERVAKSSPIFTVCSCEV